MHTLTQASAVKARTEAGNQLKSVLITADPAVRAELAGLGNAGFLRTCARFTDASSQEEGGGAGCCSPLVSRGSAGLPDRPALRADPGCGRSSGPPRHICGVSPVERSSGRRQHRRLNRGGDRQANAALHRIVLPARGSAPHPGL
ncbi:transposase [Streptomyces scabiei]|uniref:transposase n=1 Tax=Streptomyces scabiei TaxID=1930 RepID=UPI0036785445